MLLETAGIVFRTVKYGETSVIADIFTEEKGLHTFIAGSVRTAKSRMPFGLFQPMTVIDLVAYYKEDPNALNRIKEARAAAVWQSIPFDVRRGAVALFMAEICRKCILESEENRELFDFILHHLQVLDRSPHPIANLHLHFLLGLSGYLGFQPQEEDPGAERFFDLKEGIFSPVPPIHPHMDPESTALMLELMQSEAENCHEISLPKTTRKQLLQYLLQFYAFHVPGFSGIQTTAVLEMVMS